MFRKPSKSRKVGTYRRICMGNYLVWKENKFLSLPYCALNVMLCFWTTKSREATEQWKVSTVQVGVCTECSKYTKAGCMFELLWTFIYVLYMGIHEKVLKITSVNSINIKDKRGEKLCYWQRASYLSSEGCVSSWCYHSAQHKSLPGSVPQTWWELQWNRSAAAGILLESA